MDVKYNNIHVCRNQGPLPCLGSAGYFLFKGCYLHFRGFSLENHRLQDVGSFQRTTCHLFGNMQWPYFY